MNTEDLVSVIITTFDTANLDRAINSILNQTYQNIEIIVVDDNNPGSDGRLRTENIMKKYDTIKNISYIKHDKNKNGAAARNTGIARVRGSFVCFLDDDDFYLPTRVEKSVKFLKDNPQFQGVITSVLYYSSDKKKYFNSMNSQKSGSLQFELFTNNNILGTGSNIFIKKNCFKKIKGFDEDFERFQDIEFMIRFFDYYKVGSIDEYLIVKDVKLQTRNPNYNKKKRAVDLFLEKFSSKINNMDDNHKNKTLFSFYHLLYFSATSKKELTESLTELKKYGKVSKKDILKKSILRIIPYNKLPRKDKLDIYSGKMSKIDADYARKYI